ncbi:hypothetical protein ACIRRA_36925 [Nocardia sp. NPDC101769]|uniref:hypothetical protein n=1 Tax=Nocardia sp. NPDC101769 TaxID=3364333 RepID=UPI003829EE6C
MTNTIISDGRVRTLAPDTPQAEALVLSGGCVPVAGDRDAMAAAGLDAGHIDAAAGILAVGLGPGALPMAHTVDERCAIDESVCAAETYAVAAIEWCGAE